VQVTRMLGAAVSDIGSMSMGYVSAGPGKEPSRLPPGWDVRHPTCTRDLPPGTAYDFWSVDV
jgi:hypothetical protein